MTKLAGPHVLVRNPMTALAPAASADDCFEVVLAQSDTKQWLSWRPACDPHLLVAAHAGAGGTSALRTAVLGWAARDGAAYVIDAVHRGLEGLRGWPNVHTVAGQHDGRSATIILETLHEEFERRYRHLSKGTVSSADLRPLLLAIDDYADFCALWGPEGGTDPAGLLDEEGGRGEVQARCTGARRQVHPLGVLEVLLREGRCVGIHVALRCTSCRLREAMLAGYQRLWIGQASYQESYVMWDSIIASEISSHVHGRGICSDVHGQPVKAQMVWTPDPGDANLTHEDRLQLQDLHAPVSSTASLPLQPPPQLALLS